MGVVAAWMGEFRKAEQFMGAAAVAAVDAPSLWARGHALLRKGNALWHLGYPEQTLALTTEALKLNEDLNDRYAYTAVLHWAGLNYLLCGELASAEDLFRKSLNRGTEGGFSQMIAGNTIFLGLVSALRGQPQEGLKQILRGRELRGRELLPAAGSSTLKQELRTRFFGFDLAVGYALAGRQDDAFTTLISTLEWTEQSGREAELSSMHLLKGRLFEGKSNPAEAENSFRTSIEIARCQSAKSLELRATTSLARLLAKQGRRDEGRAMLSEIYDWFTEGLHTADLKEAKALLEELKS